MARSDPLMPNAGIVARREYRDRTRSPLFLGSTVLLAILAMMVAVAPIGIRYMDRQTVTRIGVVSADTDLGVRSVAIADQLLNVPPGGAADPGWERPYSVDVIPGQDQALVMLHSGALGGFLVVGGDERVGRLLQRDETHRAVLLPVVDPQGAHRDVTHGGHSPTSPAGHRNPCR